ncbi:hypothetical protein DFQ28_009212 [Apophysomyces sp. BC1034]|nr:hypothetical protein DFQ28_009212 [Apophysomyces sp. BC1034]
MQITNNGSSPQQCNKNSCDSATVDRLGRVHKDELVRVLLQSLQNLGYRGAADVLEHESGIVLESETVSQFRQAVLQGVWTRAESLLPSLSLRDSDNSTQAILLLRQQRFLELLEARKVMKALHVLRNDITPLSQDTDRLHQLSSLMLCSSAEDVKAQAQWDGAAGQSREQLLVELQRADSRLPRSTFLKVTPMKCGTLHFQTVTFEMEHVLSSAHQFDGTSYCAWSPDDSKLLVCDSGDYCLRLWDVEDGELMHTFSEHKEQVTSCVWLPDGEHIISGSCDKIMYLWNINGRIVNRWPGKRVLDMKLSSDARRLVTVTYEKCIEVYSLDCFRLTELCQFSESSKITSLTLSHNGRYALVNIEEPPELHLWDLDTQTLVHKYSGHQQNGLVIRSTLGGENDAFVLSGSGDNCVYVWSYEHESILEVLQGHTATVNCVSWSPRNHMVFASASDDKTIRIWGLANRVDQETKSTATNT